MDIRILRLMRGYTLAKVKRETGLDANYWENQGYALPDYVKKKLGKLYNYYPDELEVDFQYRSVDELDLWRKRHPDATHKGLQLRFLRTRNGVPQKELSEITGIPLDRVTDYESGKTDVRDEDYREAMKFFFKLDPDLYAAYVRLGKRRAHG